MFTILEEFVFPQNTGLDESFSNFRHQIEGRIGLVLMRPVLIWCQRVPS